ncbi:MAG: hypothetical protein AAGG57_01485 [Pseudomonadota bacterium]
MQELKSGKAARGRRRGWREAAVKSYDALRLHLTEVDFTVRLLGHWSELSGIPRQYWEATYARPG